jgi:hypothetical protein
VNEYLLFRVETVTICELRACVLYISDPGQDILTMAPQERNAQQQGQIGQMILCRLLSAAIQYKHARRLKLGRSQCISRATLYIIINRWEFLPSQKI